MTRSILASLIIFALASPCFADETEAAKGGFETPKACYDAAYKAIKADAFWDMVPCVQPKDRNMLGFQFMFVASFSGMMNEEAKTAFEKLCEKHKVGKDVKLGGDEKEMRKSIDAAFKGVDLVAFLKDLGEHQKKYSKDAKKKMLIPEESGEIKITGDKAVAEGGKKPMHFVKIDGRWYINLTGDKAAKKKAKEEQKGEGE